MVLMVLVAGLYLYLFLLCEIVSLSAGKQSNSPIYTDAIYLVDSSHLSEFEVNRVKAQFLLRGASTFTLSPCVSDTNQMWSKRVLAQTNSTEFLDTGRQNKLPSKCLHTVEKDTCEKPTQHKPERTSVSIIMMS